MNPVQIVPDVLGIVLEFLPEIENITRFGKISPMHVYIGRKCVTKIIAREGVLFDEIRSFKRLKSLEAEYIEVFDQDEVVEVVRFVLTNKYSHFGICRIDSSPFGDVKVKCFLPRDWGLKDAFEVAARAGDVQLMSEIAAGENHLNWDGVLKEAVRSGNCEVVNYIASTGNVEDWSLAMIEALERGGRRIVDDINGHSRDKIRWELVLAAAQVQVVSRQGILEMAECASLGLKCG